MSKIANTAPIFDPVVDSNGKALLSWVLFFNNLSIGDVGTAWTPTFTSLTEVGGSATITGRYYRLSQHICFFRVTITPVTNTSATAGTTYISNFPLSASADGICGSVAGVLGGTLGMVQATTNRIYVPGWSAVTVPVNVFGFVEVSN